MASKERRGNFVGNEQQLSGYAQIMRHAAAKRTMYGGRYLSVDTY